MENITNQDNTQPDTKELVSPKAGTLSVSPTKSPLTPIVDLQDNVRKQSVLSSTRPNITQ